MGEDRTIVINEKNLLKFAEQYARRTQWRIESCLVSKEDILEALGGISERTLDKYDRLHGNLLRKSKNGRMYTVQSYNKFKKAIENKAK